MVQLSLAALVAASSAGCDTGCAFSAGVAQQPQRRYDSEGQGRHLLMGHVYVSEGQAGIADHALPFVHGLKCLSWPHLCTCSVALR
jgi:hypothetical protein